MYGNGVGQKLIAAIYSLKWNKCITENGFGVSEAVLIFSYTIYAKIVPLFRADKLRYASILYLSFIFFEAY